MTNIGSGVYNSVNNTYMIIYFIDHKIMYYCYIIFVYFVFSDPENSINRKDMCITYSNFNVKELNIITTFYEMFKVRVSLDWSDEVTHLIIKLNVDGTYARTRKCINAILSHCSIVTDEWVLKSIREKSIQPEVK